MRSAVLLVVLLLGGCAYTTAHPVAYNDKDRPGVRVYDPLPLLVVTCSNAQLAVVPNFTRGYAVEFGAVLAKNQSDLKVQEGLATEASVNLDDTALITLLQAWGEKALGAAQTLAALGASVQGPIPGMEGIWRFDFDDSGVLKGLTSIQKGTPCQPPPPPAAAAQPGPGATKPPVKKPDAKAGPPPPVKFP